MVGLEEERPENEMGKNKRERDRVSKMEEGMERFDSRMGANRKDG